ncbi:MAG: DNA polymerase III subunit gamma/tau [Bacteroidia bacterium]|nr:DNA polymerase III subunit gamma/tau [Bacteroidia bacterium]MDW8159692.1 DNA polymerase III subunit gamma/tau [Bacteroidia bacterium]
MQNYIVSARKYRPTTFSAVVGQEHVTSTLQKAVLSNSLAHAYLFCGPRGVGKTTCARILAKAVNCTQLTPQGDPCNYCDSCRAFNEGRSLNIFEMDAASNNGVDDIRALNEQVRFIPQSGKKSVYIIDEVHMLTTQAFNAFLKTLEEPPPHALFILATTEKHKILPTILSRCQKFDFRRISVEGITQQLKQIAEQENIQYQIDALQLIALKAEGGMRDALSIFDQLTNFSNRNITYEVVLSNLNILDAECYFRLLDYMKQKDHAAALLLFNEILEKGFEPFNFLIGLLEHFRNLLVGKQTSTFELLEVTENYKERYKQQAKNFSETLLLNAFQLCSEAELRYKTTSNTRLLIELLLIKLVHLGSVIDLVELEKKNN